jgi:triacylglycerol esterase/lipase EstA (alpha/beta hydrolase family)
MATLRAPSCAAARPRQAALATAPRAARTTSASRRQAPGLRRAAAAAAANGSGAGSGGGVILLPGFLYTTRQYQGLAADLSSKGFDAAVVPVSLSDWWYILRGGSFEWYLSRLDALLSEMHAKHGRVALVGHSAGGWVARLLLGSEPYQGVRYGRSSRVHTLLTLGTPHQSIEAYPFGRAEEKLVGGHLANAPLEVAGSSLKFANYFYPTAESLGGVRVVCACGDTIRGRPLLGGWGSSGSSSSEDPDSYRYTLSYASVGSGDEGSRASGGSKPYTRYDQQFAFNSYKAVCGRGDVDGDFVTPLCISQLPGAESLILPGVWHFPRWSAAQPWYGSPEISELWQPYMLEPQAQAHKAAGQSAV